MKKNAQSILEFSFVFIIIMMIFLSIIELSLYWRARYSVVNIANEVMANVQIEAQNTQSQYQIAQNALNTVKKSAGLLNLENSTFTLSGSGGSYVISSNYQKKGKSALKVFLDINNQEKNDISTGAAYIYSGIFLFKNGKEVSSGAIQSVQKF